MNALKYKYIKRALFGLLVLMALPLTVAVASADPPPAKTGLCFDQLAGNVTSCRGKTDTNGKPLSANNCYTKSDSTNYVWAETSCDSNIFSEGVGSTQSAVPSTADPSLKSCTGSKVANQCGLIDKYVNPFIKLLIILVGLVVVIGIIVGGIQYSASAGDPQKAAAGKKHITVAIVTLVCFVFLWSFLNWIVPGGLH